MADSSMTNRPAFAPFDENASYNFVAATADAEKRAAWAKAFRFSRHHFFEAENGEKALEQMRRHEASLLLCDADLPALDGVTLSRRVKEDPELGRPYVVLLIDEPKRNEARLRGKSGADEVLPKTAQTAEIVRQVRAGLRIAGLRKCLSLRNEQFQDILERYNRELEVVSGIQKALLPQTTPKSAAFDFTAFYLPSTECGGDYYDLLELDEKRHGYVIADVSGHGTPAMVTMTMIRQNFHLIARKYEEPHLLLEELNRLLFDHLPTNQYVTMLYAIIHDDTMECAYASAGHNPPVWFQAREGRSRLLDGCASFPLKLVTRDARYESARIRLESGDKMIFYTDGIPECFGPNRTIYGMERFENVINQGAASCKVEQLETAIVTDVLSFADGRPPEDDLTLSILGVH